MIRMSLQELKRQPAKIQSDSDVLLVVGIGGSYLGARAAIEFLSNSFYNVLSKEVRKTPEIYFVGNSISSKYIADLKKVLAGKDFSINIISKSGTTTEPAIAFRVFKEMLIEKYGKEEANKRIYATTDRARGALKNLANEEGYESFVVPDDVGGRFSVLTAVGLLPIAVSGADIDALMQARQTRERMHWRLRLRRILLCYMRRSATFCSGRANRSRLWQTMSRACTMYRSGGNSSTARARARIRKVFSRQRLI